MKQKLFALAFLLAAGLTSCNNDEELVKANTDYVEPGTAVIATSFYSIQTPGTKAVGDPTAAFDDEKEIKSIAFFVQVADDINLQRFESTQAIGSVGGLVNGLTEESVGNYTARFKMKMDGTNSVNIYALANYAENKLDLSGIKTAGQLNAAMSKALTDADKNPEKPLLMLGKYTATLEENQRYNADFKMDRLVARIDIINEAYNADAAKGFRLESVRLLNAKEQSNLLPDLPTQTDRIAVLPQMAIKNKVVGYDATGTATTTATEAGVILQRLDTLYAYENPNEKDATAVQINGTFNGTPVAQRVEFLKVNQATGAKEQLAIGRNNLYTIKIRPSQDSTSLSFKIDVEDWTYAKGDTLVIEQKNMMPVVKAITPAGLTAATWTAASKRIDITVADVATLAGTITFTAEGNQDSKVIVKYIGRKGATWMNNTVEQGDLQGYEQTKAGELILKREYTIDLSTIIKDELANNNTVPSDALIMIQNINNADLCDSIRVCFRPNYNGIDKAQPVLMKDNKFWAPINAGASTMTNANIARTSGDITSTCGQLFQWGRKYGFPANASASVNTSITSLGRPTGKNDLANMSKWDGIFILSSTSSFNTEGNWLLFESNEDNPTVDNMAKDAWYQQLWNANEGIDGADPARVEINDPCPKGWRVPSINEWKAIGAGETAAVSGTAWDGSNLNLTVPGKESQKNLILPAAGIRYGHNGTSTDQGSYGSYWSSTISTISTTTIQVNRVRLNSGGKLDLYTYVRANSISVRCIQE